jgi:hypothetical protein
LKYSSASIDFAEQLENKFVKAELISVFPKNRNFKTLFWVIRHFVLVLKSSQFGLRMKLLGDSIFAKKRLHKISAHSGVYTFTFREI